MHLLEGLLLAGNCHFRQVISVVILDTRSRTLQQNFFPPELQGNQNTEEILSQAQAERGHIATTAPGNIDTQGNEYIAVRITPSRAKA